MNHEQKAEKEPIYKGALIIFYRLEQDNEPRFLVVKNTKTDNITFVGGAKDDTDSTVEVAAQRETQEELGIKPEEYYLIPTQQKHAFIFGPQKPERAGCRGSYNVYLADGSSFEKNLKHSSDLKSATWMTRAEVEQALTFPDLKEVFLKTIAEIQ
ncbi:NUDIX hydrolase [Patescibacteria group bacterium]|nr:NUDIX hydrolase [Patescibacteria group bacterium]MBP9710120.1 NUDIX hydrolase [Patescibacteria group bacterium]